MEDQKDFYEWYKTKITENDQDPPDDAWQNIADELDTNEVWDRIAVELDRPSGWFSKSTYYALPALLLLLLSGGSYYYFNKTDNTFADPIGIAVNKDANSTDAKEEKTLDGDGSPSPNANGSNVEKPEKSVVEDEPDHNTAPSDAALVQQTDKATVGRYDDSAEDGNDTAIAQADNSSLEHADNAANKRPISAVESDNTIFKDGDDATATIHSESEVDTKTFADESDNDSNDEGVGTTTPFVKGVDSRASIRSVVMPDSMLVIYPVSVDLHPDSIRWISATRDPETLRYAWTIEFGITASVKNTWLLNTATLAGLERHTLTSTLPDFGKDLGMVFVYNFSPAFSAQAEGMFISEAGQRYKEYRNGKYVTRDVDLRYYSLNVLLKYNRSKAVYGLPLSGHSVIGGLYAGMLNKARENINGEKIDRSDAYQNMNYGVILGYEYNRHVLPNIVLSSGLRLNYGFPNIDTNLFSRTFTGSLDLNIAVRYRVGW